MIFQVITFTQKDACCNVQVVVFELHQDAVQRLVVAGERVFMKMMHQQLLRLVRSTCLKKEKEKRAAITE